MIKTLFTVVIRRPDQRIGFQMQKLIQMPCLVREGETLQWGKRHGTQFFDVATAFFNLTAECFTVLMEPGEGTDWHDKHISLEDMPGIQAQLEEDGWALV